ncbi:MAG: BON domain-containing protein [Gemmatimonadetes bacterium]|nr:BON domain-containing protein [Gemmatimonadota bacterium]
MRQDFEDLYDLGDLGDGEIAALIRQELEEYPDLDPDRVSLEVQGGFIRLTGRVGTEQELQQIEHVLTDVLGIGSYSNELVVDELVRGEYGEAVAEDVEIEAQTGEPADRTQDTAEHLLENLSAEMYGARDLRQAIEAGEAYNPPDQPMQQGSWSEEDH